MQHRIFMVAWLKDRPWAPCLPELGLERCFSFTCLPVTTSLKRMSKVHPRPPHLYISSAIILLHLNLVVILVGLTGASGISEVRFWICLRVIQAWHCGLYVVSSPSCPATVSLLCFLATMNYQLCSSMLFCHDISSLEPANRGLNLWDCELK